MAENASPYETHAKTVERLYTLTLLVAILCIIALFGPDYSLLAADAVLKIPYIGVEVSVASFLIFGPAALLIAWAYLQLALERLNQTRTAEERLQGFYIFDVDAPVFKVVWQLTLYGVVPLVLVVFIWKALPRPEAWMLTMTFMMALLLSLVLYARRTWRGRRVGKIRWLTLGAVAALTTLVALNAPGALLNSLLPHRKIDLVRANFKDKDLRDTNLEKANMEGAILENAALQRANLAGADLRGAKLMRALAQGATFQSAVMSGADLTEAWLQPDTLLQRRTNLTHALLRNTTMKATNLHRANLDNAELRESPVQNTSFREASLHKARIVHSTLTAVDFTEADLRETEWQESVISDTSFTRANLAGADFAMATITRSSFAGARLQGAEFRDAVLVNVSFVGAAGLKSIDWSAIKLCSADFAGEELADVKFEGAVLRGAFFQKTDLSRANLKEADLTGALLTGAILAGADLTDASFARATLTRADLKGAKLDRADFSDADLTGAQLDMKAFGTAMVKGATFSADDFQKLGASQRLVAKQATEAADRRANRRGALLGGGPLPPSPDDPMCTRAPVYGGR